MKVNKTHPSIVVFVGAGASKSAFSECPLMSDYFDRAVELVGSEIGKAMPDREIIRIVRALMMLEVHGLFQTSNPKSMVVAGHLWDRFRHESLWRNPYHNDFMLLLKRYLKAWKSSIVGIDGQLKCRIENLEQVFLTIDQMSDKALLDKRFRKDREFERSLFAFFSSIYRRRSANSSGYHQLRKVIRHCVERLTRSDTALVVNLNYDAFFDHALCHTFNPPNVPSLYGGLFEFEIKTPEAKKIRRIETLPISIVKPHGSITWWHSRGGKEKEYACSSMGTDGWFYIPKFDETCFFHRTTWYHPKRWIRPILIPPKPQKNHWGPCLESWHEMVSGVYSAKEIWLIGWSMPHTDEYLIKGLLEAVKKRPKPVQWLRIVNTQNGKKQGLENRAEQVFRPKYTSSHWDGLQTWQG